MSTDDDRVVIRERRRGPRAQLGQLDRQAIGYEIFCEQRRDLRRVVAQIWHDEQHPFAIFDVRAVATIHPPRALARTRRRPVAVSAAAGHDDAERRVLELDLLEVSRFGAGDALFLGHRHDCKHRSCRTRAAARRRGVRCVLGPAHRLRVPAEEQMARRMQRVSPWQTKPAGPSVSR
ncbi:MAG TPA: hypothetical protein VMJ10_06590 [Kofleriaceae bacterium]|nr:hypothetical protein [Kofleriaceae bacterium]